MISALTQSVPWRAPPTIFEYRAVAFLKPAASWAPITLSRVVRFLISFPAVTRSGQWTRWKSRPAFRPLPRSRIGRTIRAIVPGATVDSIETSIPGRTWGARLRRADFSALYSGSWVSSLIGVSTLTIAASAPSTLA